MLRPGLCSVGFSRLPWREVLALAVQARLEGIEWNEAHVPVGHLPLAHKVRSRTEAAGLVNCSYGSYYRAGVSEPTLPFELVLQTALALGAPLIRIWAGHRNSELLTARERQAIVEDLLRVGRRAAAEGLAVGLEYHGNSLTNSPSSVYRLMQELPPEAIRFYWQVPTGMAGTPELARATLRQVLPRLAYVHVFHWTGQSGEFQRHPLADARENWLGYIREARQAPGEAERWALLEFTKDDSPQQMIDDATVLAELVRSV